MNSRNRSNRKTKSSRVITTDEKRAKARFDKKEIVNNVTGQVIRFLAPGGIDSEKGLNMESIYPSFSQEPIMHYHPSQEEYFTILKGELTVKYKQETTVYSAGESIKIEANKAHAMWNAGFIPAIVTWKVFPALETERFLRNSFLSINDSDPKTPGRPNMLIMFYLLKRYNKVFRVVQPGFPAVNIISCLLYPLYYLKGYPRKFG